MTTTGWDNLADWWNIEAEESGIYHQRTDIDPIIKTILGSVRKKMMIEIGCGNGYFSRFLARNGARITAIDASSKMIGVGVAEEKRLNLGIRYLKRDAANLQGIVDGSFDVALANMSLLDVRRVDLAIREIGRVLKLGGTFIFSITHPAFMFEGTWEKLSGKNRYGRIVWRYLNPYTKFTYWDEKRYAAKNYIRPLEFYVAALRHAGFSIIDLREIASKKPIVREKNGGKDASRLIFKYSDTAQKREKLRARNEIPCFLVVVAQKNIKSQAIKIR